MHGTHDPTLLALSVAVAMLASYAALDLANVVAVKRGQRRALWLGAGALAMGTGIWSMHFIGMLAFRLPGTEVLYDLPLVVLSIAVAILASGLALFVASRRAAPLPSLVIAAVIMGVAIAGMHYIGMWSMRMPAQIAWDRGRVAASLFIAVAASFLALWIAFRYRYDRSASATWIRIGGGALMGLAIVGMHYTGMSAAQFVMSRAADAGRPGGQYLIASGGLAVAILMATLFILLSAIGGAAVSRELDRRARVAEQSVSRSAGLEQQATKLEALNAESRLAEQRLRAILDSALDAMITINGHSVITAWNHVAETMFGWTAAEAVGRTLTETIIPPAHRVAHAQGIRRFLATGEARILNRRIEITALRRNGEEFPIELAIARIAGDADAAFISFIRDLSAQKAAERRERESLAREQRMLASEQERARLTALFEQAPAAISFLEGPDHVITLRNARYEELAGRPDLLGKPLREAFPELVDQGFIDMLDEVRATGQPYVGTGSRVVLNSAHGPPKELYVNFVNQPIRDADGTVTGIFTHSVDVTDIVVARQEAEAASRAKDEFLSRMSHEFRTPLNAILGFGQLLELEVVTEANRESVQQVTRAGRHLLGLIDEILDISRIESGQIALSAEPVSVKKVVEESIDLVRLIGEKRGVRVLVAPSATDLCVMADPQRLKQVLLNLLSNAIKYNRAGGTVTVSWQRVGEERARIVVDDTGPGIPPERADRLFTPFERLGAEDTGVEGFGLGLALSRGLAEAMGGTLEVASREGEGSRFVAELAVGPSACGEAPVPLPVPIPQPAIPNAKRHTVLVVEDNPANLRLMERLFRRRPEVKLVTAMQGRLGIELAREHLPDLVLLDLNLPDLPGDKVLLALREDPQLRSIPVIMISGDAIPTQVQRLLTLGADAYLTKPFDLDEFYRIVDDRLAAARS